MKITKEQLEKRIKELEYENTEIKQKLKDIQKNERGAGRKKKATEEQENEIQRTYGFGVTMDKLAKKFNLSKGTVFNIIHAD